MSTLNDLLSQVDDAFEAVEAKAEAAATIRADAAYAVDTVQAELDAVKADHGQRVAQADQAVAQARAVLAGLQQQMNARLGAMTGGDARVNIR